MLEDSRAKVMLTDANANSSGGESSTLSLPPGCHRLVLTDMGEIVHGKMGKKGKNKENNGGESPRPTVAVREDGRSLSYVLYTSG